MHKKIRFIASIVTAMFSNLHNTVVDYTEATVEWKQWVAEDSGKTVKLQAIRRLCKTLLMIMLNC